MKYKPCPAYKFMDMNISCIESGWLMHEFIIKGNSDDLKRIQETLEEYNVEACEWED